LGFSIWRSVACHLPPPPLLIAGPLPRVRPISGGETQSGPPESLFFLWALFLFFFPDPLFWTDIRECPPLIIWLPDHVFFLLLVAPSFSRALPRPPSPPTNFRVGFPLDFPHNDCVSLLVYSFAVLSLSSPSFSTPRYPAFFPTLVKCLLGRYGASPRKFSSLTQHSPFSKASQHLLAIARPFCFVAFFSFLPPFLDSTSLLPFLPTISVFSNLPAFFLAVLSPVPTCYIYPPIDRETFLFRRDSPPRPPFTSLPPSLNMSPWADSPF